MSSQMLLAAISGSTLLIVAMMIAMVRFAPVAQAAGAAPAEPRRFAAPLIALVAWMMAAVGLAVSGVYIRGTAGLPTIQFGILIPIVLGVAAYLTSPGARAFVRGLPQGWLVGVQVYRVIGGIFLILWSTGQLPAVFALPAGAGDIAVGLAAPLVAWAASKRGGRAAVILWNILGLADLVVALTMGFLTSPSKFQMFAFDAPNVMVGQFPLILIPTFLVPLSILLHLASLAGKKA